MLPRLIPELFKLSLFLSLTLDAIRCSSNYYTTIIQISRGILSQCLAGDLSIPIEGTAEHTVSLSTPLKRQRVNFRYSGSLFEDRVVADDSTSNVRAIPRCMSSLRKLYQLSSAFHLPLGPRRSRTFSHQSNDRAHTREREEGKGEENPERAGSTDRGRSAAKKRLAAFTHRHATQLARVAPGSRLTPTRGCPATWL